jgi:hypothetical protein
LPFCLIDLRLTLSFKVLQLFAAVLKIVLTGLGWYVRFMLKIKLGILFRKTGVSLNFKIKL